MLFDPFLVTLISNTLTYLGVFDDAEFIFDFAFAPPQLIYSYLGIFCLKFKSKYAQFYRKYCFRKLLHLKKALVLFFIHNIIIRSVHQDLSNDGSYVTLCSVMIKYQD